MTTLITPLPTPPTRQDSSNFNDRADEFLGALPLFQQEANGLAVDVQSSADEVEIAKQAVVSVANVIKWVPGNTYSEGSSVWSPVNGVAYRKVTNSVGGTTDPSLDTMNYKSITDAAGFTYMPAGAGAVTTTVQEVLRETVSVKRFGAVGDWNGTTGTDDTDAINNAITHLAVNGGGVLRGIAGATSYIAGTIIVPSNVTLDFGSYTLRGTGTNTLIESGYLSGLSVVSNISEYGAGFDGMGTHFVENAVIKGVKLKNAAIGIRLHRFNYGCVVEGASFDATLSTRSILATHCWSLGFVNNYVGRLARFQDFVDWTTIHGNSFEQTGTTALSIGTGGYGGSYSCRIWQNGFHGNQTAIQVTCECSNLEISNNHFENNVTAIDGDGTTKSNWFIHNNWIKANTSPSAACIGIQSAYLANSRVLNNTFTTDGISTFSSIITLNSSNIFGIEVDVPYLVTPTGTIPAGYNLANTVLVRKLMGTNNASNSQPQLEQFAGSGSYTFEKYVSKYNFVNNSIPLCTVSNNGTGTYYVDTFIECDEYGVRSPVMFDISIGGATTYICMGIVGRFDIANIVNKELFSGGTGLTITASNNSGRLRLTFAGASTVSNVSGFVKAL